MNQDLLPLAPKPFSEEELRSLSAVTLSFLGDAVHTLYARLAAVRRSNAKPGVLQRAVAQEVGAVGQAAAFRRVLPFLTSEEREIAMRCRNAHTATVSKNAPVLDYRLASGFEGLIGFLYLSGQHDRLNEIFAIGYPSPTEEFPDSN